MVRTNKAGLSAQMRRHSKKEISKPNSNLNIEDLVPMGSTLLNLAMSGSIYGGAKKGTMINIIGSSHGGKSILALTSFAETCVKESFDDYSFIYDDVERANSFDMDYLFGKKATKRIVAPRLDKSDNFSITVQHLQANVLHHLKKNKPFIYVLDSFDALDAMEDQKKMEEMVNALEKEKKDTAGTYGMAKAKAASSILRSITNNLANSKSVIYIISQTRDNVDPRSFQKETRSGGRALKFYASHEIWLAPIGMIKKSDTVIGNKIRAKITKNKLTGKVREVEFDIYYDYGIDDIGSCIDYLLSTKRWSGGGVSKIDHNKDFDFQNCTRPKMINLIESDNSYYKKLKKLVGKEWNQFEESIRLNRKSKYD